MFMGLHWKREVELHESHKLVAARDTSMRKVIIKIYSFNCGWCGARICMWGVPFSRSPRADK